MKYRSFPQGGQNAELKGSNHPKYAVKYFEARDYPACSNYLRKEIERLIKLRLPEEYFRHFEGKPKALSHLWELCIDRYAKLRIPIDEEVKRMFDLTRLVLLNPLSHDSLHYPIFKRELEDAFKLVEKVKAHPVVNQIVIITKGAQLEFSHPKGNYSFTFKLNQDWRLDIHNGIRCIEYPRCKVVEWQYNGNKFWDFRTSATLSKELQGRFTSTDDKLIKVLEKLEKEESLKLDRETILKNTIVENHWTLKSYFDKIEESDRSLFERLSILWTNIKFKICK